MIVEECDSYNEKVMQIDVAQSVSEWISVQEFKTLVRI